MNAKKLILGGSIIAGILLGGLVVSDILAQTCPSDGNTRYGERDATLVGELTSLGGESSATVWFEYGTTTNLGSTTPSQTMNTTGIYCYYISNLNPCTKYYYRAVARNNAGTSYGEIKNFTTTCLTPVVDLKVDNSNGPLNRKYNDTITLSWTSSNAQSCTASGDWSGSVGTSGSRSIQLTQVKTYNFVITCQRTGYSNVSDNVQVNVSSLPPTVITKPAVVTL